MATRKSKPDIDREFILETIGENALFEKYLGFGIDYEAQFCNPLRTDNDPGCRFYWNGYKTKFNDIARRFNEDAFGIVMAKYRLTFGQAIRKIAEDFGLLDPTHSYTFEKVLVPIPPKDDVIIHHRKRNWTLRDQDYWGNLYVGSEELTHFDTDSVGTLFTHARGRDSFYSYKDTDLCYAYREGIYTKIYRPELPSHQGKFYNSIPKRLYHGFRQLPDQCDCIIITKSMKDVIVLFILGYFAVAPISENQIISPNGFKLLQAKTPYIYSLFDNDATGMECARLHEESYGIPGFFITNGTKDASGYIRQYDYQEVKQFMDYQTQQLKNLYDDRDRIGGYQGLPNPPDCPF